MEISCNCRENCDWEQAFIGHDTEWRSTKGLKCKKSNCKRPIGEKLRFFAFRLKFIKALTRIVKCYGRPKWEMRSCTNVSEITIFQRLKFITCLKDSSFITFKKVFDEGVRLETNSGPNDISKEAYWPHGSYCREINCDEKKHVQEQDRVFNYCPYQIIRSYQMKLSFICESL